MRFSGAFAVRRRRSTTGIASPMAAGRARGARVRSRAPRSPIDAIAITTMTVPIPIHEARVKRKRGEGAVGSDRTTGAAVLTAGGVCAGGARPEGLEVDEKTAVLAIAASAP